MTSSASVGREAVLTMRVAMDVGLRVWIVLGVVMGGVLQDGAPG